MCGFFWGFFFFTLVLFCFVLFSSFCCFVIVVVTLKSLTQSFPYFLATMNKKKKKIKGGGGVKGEGGGANLWQFVHYMDRWAAMFPPPTPHPPTLFFFSPSFPFLVFTTIHLCLFCHQHTASADVAHLVECWTKKNTQI